jgi:hypothetical protein
MADRYGCEPEVKPPATGFLGAGTTSFEGTDSALTKAAMRVAAINDRLVKMNLEDTPRTLAFAEALDDGRDALLDLVEIPAQSPRACCIKLATLKQLTIWYQEGDPDILNCFVAYAHEVTALLHQSAIDKPGTDDPSRALALSKSVRWFLGIAGAVPSALFSRWDSGGLS